MNEEFIKQFRKVPDTDFVEKIQARLEKKERSQRVQRYSFLSLLTLLFAFGMLMTFSSNARAYVLQTLEEIAGLQFEVTNDYPGERGEPVTELDAERLPWEEARDHFLSPLQLPTYAPEGYEREADTHLYISADGKHVLEVFWSKEGQFPRIGLAIAQCKTDDSNCGLIVGEDTLEEITINGKPAVLVRGAWNADTQKYDPSVWVSLVWRYDDNATYWLWSGEQSLMDELIKMAESIP
jgi:hypothetical protein